MERGKEEWEGGEREGGVEGVRGRGRSGEEEVGGRERGKGWGR